ncbi:MAG: hypothetical protein FWD23_09940 [Oscillospiraceae bacterium]|nr:hypothetical protein [Oscillospiraceae bacterium]
MKYALLQNPGHNRVYFASSGKLAKNELAALFSGGGGEPEIPEIKEEMFGGVEYITFSSKKELTENEAVLLSRLSFVYAVFEVCEGGLFLPAEKTRPYFFGGDLNTMLKYTGKTNEIFTRMMINLAVLASGYKDAFLDNLFVLDPVCGKGTAVFESLICGYNAFGLDINKKQIEEAAQFLKKYLETGKYKHAKKEEKFSGAGFGGAAFRSTRHSFDIAKNKADQKNEKNLLCEFTDGDTRDAGRYYKKETFHIIAGDLPYGIQHENTTGKDKMRNPLELITTSLPAWTSVLKPQGALALSWNTFLLKREELARIFAENGLALADFGDFSHRVDQAINRDLIIGVKR